MRMGGAGARNAAKHINGKKRIGAEKREQREIARYGLVENKQKKEIDTSYLK